jgi:hypothetical protein
MFLNVVLMFINVVLMFINVVLMFQYFAKSLQCIDYVCFGHIQLVINVRIVKSRTTCKFSFIK